MEGSFEIDYLSEGWCKIWVIPYSFLLIFIKDPPLRPVVYVYSRVTLLHTCHTQHSAQLPLSKKITSIWNFDVGLWIYVCNSLSFWKNIKSIVRCSSQRLFLTFYFFFWQFRFKSPYLPPQVISSWNFDVGWWIYKSIICVKE